MVKIMHDFMFSPILVRYLVPATIFIFLGGWLLGIIMNKPKIPAVAMLINILIIVLAGLFVFVYWLIGGMAMYPNG